MVSQHVAKKILVPVLVICVLASVWVWVHQSMLLYGTSEVPLHKTHIGDEQSPVNAALHMLKDLNPLSIRESGTYYGPVMATLSVPAAVADFAWRLGAGQVDGRVQYQDLLVWDWGGVLYFSRVVAALAGFLGICALFLLIREITDTSSRFPAFLAAFLLATNLIYFEYAAFFRVWIFIVSAFLWQLYLTVLISKGRISINRGFILSALVGVFSFGLNYLTILFQIFLAPYFFAWIKQSSKKLLLGLVYYTIIYVAGVAAIIAWYPRPFFNMLQIGTGSQSLSVEVGLLTTITNTGLYYGEIFLISNLPLVLIVLIAAIFFRRVLSPEKRLLLMSVLVTAAAYAALILSVGWTHARYSLPLMVCFVVVVSVILTSDIIQGRWGVRAVFLRRLLPVLAVVQISFGMIGAVTIARSFEGLPSEIAVVQSLPSESTIVVVRPRYYGLTELVGVAHTQATYEAFFASLGLQKLEYYDYLLSTQPPANQERYTIYYTDFDTVLIPKEVLNSADYFLYCTNPIWLNTTRPDPFSTNFFQSYYPEGMKEECRIL